MTETSTPSDMRERIARVIEPSAFEEATSLHDRVWKCEPLPDARTHALTKADAILALLPRPVPVDGLGDLLRRVFDFLEVEGENRAAAGSEMSDYEREPRELADEVLTALRGGGGKEEGSSVAKSAAAPQEVCPAGAEPSGWRADCPRCVGSKFTCDEHFREARLMAAAPDMLRALKIARCNGQFDDPSFGEVIDEAIAKAEGR